MTFYLLEGHQQSFWAISVPTETVEGSPGLIVIEKDGRRLFKSMPWGFPLRLQGMKPDSKPKPVNKYRRS
ncbi:hypothetical protein pRL120427 [Rhizobium johnstonii 3841]|uniref:Uncharacterized protein n=1 Tax=Rhizobium johnstonii (strain DSM 114642 / LMG 32736 / 3841) TaxID=216596 RepID=Q1M436_RHIJ3|nr:hypothetical protein pRL120427 [Rhizobium johnstonii 3841]